MTNHPPLFVMDEHGNPVPEPDIAKWCQFLGCANRYLARDEVGNSIVSTVFIGCGHQMFETVIFGGGWDGKLARYSTRIDALAGHAGFVASIRAIAENAPETGSVNQPINRSTEP